MILESVHSFPALSTAAAKVLDLLRDPNTNVLDVEDAVRYDPGLTANILKLANSAYFGFPGTISSVSQAISNIGWKRMYQLVIASAVNTIMAKPIPGYDLAPGELWRQAVSGSIAAEVMARRIRNRATSDAATAALLRDMGKLALGDHVDTYIEPIHAAVTCGKSFDAAEREVLGTDHAEVGSQILGKWAFPEDMVAAVRWHHTPDDGATGTLIDVVHVADAIAGAIGNTDNALNLRKTVSANALTRLGLQPADLDALSAATSERLPPRVFPVSSMSLRAPSAPTVRSLANSNTFLAPSMPWREARMTCCISPDAW